MKAEDLSIGDWVCAEQLCGVNNEPRLTPPMKVVGLGESWVNLEIDPEQGDPFEFEPSEIRGIPITAEVLKKNGYDVSESEDWLGEPMIEAIADESALVTDSGEWKVRIFNRMPYIYSYCYIKYIHQLQHTLRLAGYKKQIVL